MSQQGFDFDAASATVTVVVPPDAVRLVTRSAAWIEDEDYGRVLRVEGDYAGRGAVVVVTVDGADVVGTVVKHHRNTWCKVSQTRQPNPQPKAAAAPKATRRPRRQSGRRVTVRQPRQCPECGGYRCPTFECMA